MYARVSVYSCENRLVSEDWMVHGMLLLFTFSFKVVSSSVSVFLSLSPALVGEQQTVTDTTPGKNISKSRMLVVTLRSKNKKSQNKGVGRKGKREKNRAFDDFITIFRKCRK